MALTRFARAAWAALGLTVAVIAGGAVVRATGSGAGCGSDWPTCRGGVVPFEGTAETVIEFAHRASSGIAFLAVVGLAVWAYRRFAPGSGVRRAATAAALFMVVEVAIGAMLVRNDWVGDDASVARAVVDGLHLVNTLFLVAALALVAWWASGGAPVAPGRWRAVLPLLVGLVAVVVVAAAGALTALGDTLFPEAGISADFDNSSHFLVRLRVIHPVAAIVTAAYLVGVARLEAGRAGGWLAGGLTIAVMTQVVVGVINLALGAPLGLQVVHIVLANVLWVLLVLLTAHRMTMPAERVMVAA